MSETKERQSYVGIAPCGCIHGASVIDGRERQALRSFVLKLMRDGLRIETRTCANVRESAWWCETCSPEKYQTAFVFTPTEGARP